MSDYDIYNKVHLEMEHTAEDMTYCGITHWYKSMMEKTGWIFTCNEECLKDKLKWFFESLVHLHKGLISYKNTVPLDGSHSHDIKAMINRTIKLINLVKEQQAKHPIDKLHQAKHSIDKLHTKLMIGGDKKKE